MRRSCPHCLRRRRSQMLWRRNKAMHCNLRLPGPRHKMQWPMMIRRLFDSSGMPNLFAGLVGINTEPLLLQPIELPIASAHSNTAGGVLKNAAQDAGTDPLNPRNSTSASPSNSGTSKAEAGAANSFDAPIHGVQGSNADLSQSDAHAPRVSASDLSPLQVQTAVNQSVSPEATATPRSAAHTSEGFHTGVQQEASVSVETDNVEAMAASAISTAKLMQTMSETEMRVGISSSDFGDISIRTSVSNHQMLAQISVDHSELSQVISAHASSVQAKLGDEYGLQTLIEINNVASSNSSEQGQSSQQGGGTPSGSLTTEDIAAPAEEEIGLIPRSNSGGRHGEPVGHQGIRQRQSQKGQKREHSRIQPNDYSAVAGGKCAASATKTSTTSGTSGTSSSSSTGGLSATNLESTFLNLLATELQNQVQPLLSIQRKWLANSVIEPAGSTHLN